MNRSVIETLAQKKTLRRAIGRPFLSISNQIWKRLPIGVAEARPLRFYGEFIQSLVQQRFRRTQNHGTLFLRNRPQLELIRRYASGRTSTVKILVVACSNGAEAYSIAWTVRSGQPDLKLRLTAVDISKDIVEIAKEGRYSLHENRLVWAPIFERLTGAEMANLFDRDNDRLQIKSWIREGIDWQVADAADPELTRRLGGQDIVVANNFLCHMTPPEAERCLRNIARLVKPGGLLCVSGVDLNVRTKVAGDLKWSPEGELLEEIHDGDSSLRRDWPWRYWGLEPFTRRKRDWRIRYASVFRCGSSPEAMSSSPNRTESVSYSIAG